MDIHLITIRSQQKEEVKEALVARLMQQHKKLVGYLLCNNNYKKTLAENKSD